MINKSVLDMLLFGKMTRREFIESHGATCTNWQWSWSFINHDDQIIIMGAWEDHTKAGSALIFSDDWEYRRKRRQPSWSHTREHLRLIEEEGYTLATFPMVARDVHAAPRQLMDFTPELTPQELIRVGRNWFAVDGSHNIQLAEESADSRSYIEGAGKTVTVNVYERNADARRACIAHYDNVYRCEVCHFRFADAYGELGKEYIHVHHLVPLSQIKAEYKLDPVKDLIPICPNCHAMIHRFNPCLTVDELKQRLME